MLGARVCNKRDEKNTMKSLVLYPYPTEYDGQSLQGHYLLKGLQECGEESIPCGRGADIEKEQLYSSYKPDVVYGIGFWGDAPEIISHPLAHGMTPVPWLNANGWVANYHSALNSLPLILATSSWVKATYIRDGVKGENIQVAHIGYDPEIFYPRKRDEKEITKLRRELGLADDDVMILTAGGDVTSKGAQEIFRALATLDPSLKWKYVCKIWPSKSARVHGIEEMQLMNELGIDPSRVVYLKKKYDPAKMAVLLNACDVYAAPSRLEGFGMIQVEAMACGKPVVSINVGGPKDTVVDGKTGFLVDVASEIKLESEWALPRQGFEKRHKIYFPEPKTFAYRADVGQLAHALDLLIRDSALRAGMGAAAAKHAYEKFNYRATAKHIAELTKRFVLERQTVAMRVGKSK